MNESQCSELKGFDTEDMANLAIGIGQMTGLDDKDVELLMMCMPKTGTVKVLDISSPELEKSSGLAQCIKVTFSSGQTYKIAKIGQEGRYHIYEMSVPAKAPDPVPDPVRFEPKIITGRYLDGSIQTEAHGPIWTDADGISWTATDVLDD